MKTASKLTYALISVLCALTPSAWALDPVDHQPIPNLVAALKGSGEVRIDQGMQDILAKDDNGQAVPAASPLMLTTNKSTGEWTISVLNDKTVGSTVLIGSGLQQISSGEAPSLASFDRNKANETLARMNARGTGYYPDEIQRLSKDSGCTRQFSGKVAFTQTSALAMATAYNQYKIDSNILTINIDGQDIKMSQGALRTSMINRVKELEAKRAQLQNSNGDPNEIAKTNALLAKYGAEKSRLGEVTAPDFTTLKPVFMDLLAAPNGEFHVLVVDQNGACVEIARGGDFSPK